jgi:hypothetical protein
LPGGSWCGAHARGKGMGLRPGRFLGTVGLRSPRPRQGGRWGCAPRGPLASPGSPFISRHPGETRSSDSSSEAPLAHPFGTGPAGLVPPRLSRSFVHKSSRGVADVCDGWSSKGRAPRVPPRRGGQGAFLRSRRIESSRMDAPLHTVGGAGGCKGAARGAAPSAPLPRAWAAQAHRSQEAPGAQPHPLAAGVGCASPPFPRSHLFPVKIQYKDIFCPTRSSQS